MAQEQFNDKALEQKARSERLYLNYALALAFLLFVAGVVLTVLGVGDHMDIVVERGDLSARFVNATPGIALALIGAAIFVLSKPRRLSVRTKSKSTAVETVAASPVSADASRSGSETGTRAIQPAPRLRDNVPSPPARTQQPPMRLDLDAVRREYGEEAARQVPPDIQIFAAHKGDTDRLVKVAQQVRATLSEPKPLSLAEFLVRPTVIGGDPQPYQGIVDTDGFIAWMTTGKARFSDLAKKQDAPPEQTQPYTLEAACATAYRERYFDRLPDGEEFLKALARDVRRNEHSPNRTFRPDQIQTLRDQRDAKVWKAWFNEKGIPVEAEPERIKSRLLVVLSPKDANALGPAEAAAKFGFADGWELLTALKAASEREAHIAAETEKRMDARGGDPFESRAAMYRAHRWVEREMDSRRDEIEAEALRIAIQPEVTSVQGQAELETTIKTMMGKKHSHQPLASDGKDAKPVVPKASLDIAPSATPTPSPIITRTITREDEGHTLYQSGDGGYESVDIDELEQDLRLLKAERERAEKSGSEAQTQFLREEEANLKGLLHDQKRLRDLRLSRGE